MPAPQEHRKCHVMAQSTLIGKCSAPVQLEQLGALSPRAVVGVLEQPVALRVAVRGLPHEVAVVVHVHRVRGLQAGVRGPARLQRLPGVPAARACRHMPSGCRSDGTVPALQRAAASSGLGCSLHAAAWRQMHAFREVRAHCGLHLCGYLTCRYLPQCLPLAFVLCLAEVKQDVGPCCAAGFGTYQGPAQWLCEWGEYWWGYIHSAPFCGLRRACLPRNLGWGTTRPSSGSTTKSSSLHAGTPAKRASLDRSSTCTLQADAGPLSARRMHRLRPCKHAESSH